MKYLHTMIRVTELDRSLRFYTEGLGFQLVRRSDYEKDRFTLVFLRASGDPESAMIELTHNWDTHAYQRGNAYGHVAYRVTRLKPFRVTCAKKAMT